MKIKILPAVAFAVFLLLAVAISLWGDCLTLFPLWVLAGFTGFLLEKDVSVRQWHSSTIKLLVGYCFGGQFFLFFQIL